MQKEKNPEIPSEVMKIIKDIKDMKIRGAGKIARSAAQALKKAALSYEGKEEDYREYIWRIGGILAKARPTAVSLPNAVFYVLTRIRNLEGEEARRKTIEAADDFIEFSLKALDKLSEIGSRIIEENDTILTHCHSTAVVSVLKKAFQSGKKIKVYNTETRPKFQGRITAKQLSDAGIPVTHITDSSIRTIMTRIDKVIVGADTVTSDGHLINKVGTSQIALAAYEAGVPFYSATESIKFSPASIAGGEVVIEERSPYEVVSEGWLSTHKNVSILNPAFDITDPEFIVGFITDLGILPPRAAVIVIREVFGLSSGYLQLKMIEEETEYSMP